MKAEKVKKRKINKKRVAILVIVLLAIVFAVCFLIFTKNSDSSSKKVKEVKTVDTIKGYDYTLAENETKYYKSLFKKLKTVLEADEVDEEEYAKLVTQLFIADFYNLDNKVSKSDIGGTQFVYKSFRDDFESIAKTTMYKGVKSNIYGDRTQNLPEVTKADVTLENTTFEYSDTKDEKAYKATFEIEYAEDLGYQDKGTITLIHNDKKLEIAALE